MPTAWTRLLDLKPTSFRANVKLRLIRAYDLHSFRDDGEIYARECLFHDNEGNRALAIFGKEDFPLFNPALKEGRLYRVTNSGVITNNKPHIASWKFKLSFGKRTIVAETFDESFPHMLFNFKPFQEINQITDFDNTPMFDVIGGLILENNAVTKPIGGKDKLIMDVFLEDLEGKRVACTLWGDYVSDLIRYLEKAPRHPVVAVIQFCKAGKYNGMIKASTFYNVSKMWLDDTIPEIQTFKQRYVLTTSSASTSFSLSLSTCTPSNVKIRTIEEVIHRKEPGRFWIRGSVACIENPGSWNYTSCKGCPRKKCPSESAIPCSVCKAQGVVLRYRLKVQVVDDTGNVCLVLWDKHCLKLFGRKSEEMVKKNENPGELPFEIEELVEKTFMFEVEVSKARESLYKDSFSVNQVSNDPAFIEKYSLETPNTQESVSQVKNASVLNGEAHILNTTEKEDMPICSTSGLDEQSSEGITDKPDLKRDLMDDFECLEEGNGKRAKKSVKLEKN